MSLFKFLVFTLLGLLAVTAAPQSPLHGQCCGTCGDSCLPAAPLCPIFPPPTAQCTVLVPQVVTENCTQTVTRYRRETRQRTIVVYRDVPITKTVEESYMVMVPETRTRTVVETVNHPIYRDLELRKTAMVPRIETRQATRTVCRMVPVQEERTVCEIVDRGETAGPAVIRTAGYERELAAVDSVPSLPKAPPEGSPTAAPDRDSPPSPPVAAAPAGPVYAGAGNSCWQPACTTCPPAVIQRKINVTCMKPVSERETIPYPVTRFQQNARLETVSFYEFEPEKVTHEEKYVVQVPQQRVRTRQVTETRTVPVEQRVPYTLLVPYHKEIQVPVSVIRYVPQQITVPACDPCGG